jgi:NhaP-type Na+/H+ or K+/H+ antiporter
MSFIYGSLISATDPVSVIGALKSMEIEKMLSILIFGESILNDAVSLTLYE